MDIFSAEYALLTTQHALFGEVIPELRAVIIDVDQEARLLYINLYQDGKITEKQEDTRDCVISEASASLQPEFWLKQNIKRLDSPKKISSNGYYAYLRQETDALQVKKNQSRKPEIQGTTSGYALLAVQYALLGVVTPELRAVVVDVSEKKKSLYIRFYYDQEVPSRQIVLWHNAGLEASANFHPDYILDADIKRVDYPKVFPFHGRYAYRRKE